MIIPANYAQANLKFGGSGVPNGAEVTFGLNVLGFTGDPADAAAGVRSALVTSGIMTNICDTVQVDTFSVKFGPNATGPSADVLDTVAGSLSNTITPPNVAILIRKQTNTGGRQGRGRIYWPGLPEGGVGTGGYIEGSWLTDLGVAFASFRDELEALDLSMVLLHGESSPADAPHLVTSLVVDAKVATQRRRLR